MRDHKPGATRGVALQASAYGGHGMGGLLGQVRGGIAPLDGGVGWLGPPDGMEQQQRVAGGGRGSAHRLALCPSLSLPHKRPHTLR